MFLDALLGGASDKVEAGGTPASVATLVLMEIVPKLGLEG